MRFHRPARSTCIAFASAVAVLCAASIGRAQTGPSVLYGSDAANHDLIAIDPATAAPTVIGPFGNLTLGSITWDRASGFLYGSDTSIGGAFYRLDTTTGAATFVGNTGVNFLHGLAFHPQTGVLYAVNTVSNLYTIDKLTAAITLVGNTGFQNIHALEFDTTTGVLYGAHAGGTAAGFLITIDVQTGAGTFVASTHRINGLAIDASGAMYASQNGLFPGSPNPLLSVDKETGAWSVIGTINTGNVLGLTFSEIYAPIPICFGDGTGLACPCGNNGAPGNGCANSVVAAGARLASTGTASIANDTLALHGSGMPDSFALYYQGTTVINNGLGTAFGDGLRCAGGSVLRLGTRLNVAGASTFPGGGGPPISVQGQVTVPGLRTYQVWYRNAATYCTVATFNLTNGLSVIWTI